MINVNFTLVVQIINFIVLTYLLNRILFKPLLRLFDYRSRKIEEFNNKAIEAEKDCQARLKEYADRIQDARNIAEQERLRLRQQAVEKRQDILLKAKIEADKITAAIRDDIVKQTKLVKAVIQKEGELLSKEIAGEVLGRKVA